MGNFLPFLKMYYFLCAENYLHIYWKSFRHCHGKFFSWLIMFINIDLISAIIKRIFSKNIKFSMGRQKKRSKGSATFLMKLNNIDMTIIMLMTHSCHYAQNDILMVHYKKIIFILIDSFLSFSASCSCSHYFHYYYSIPSVCCCSWEKKAFYLSLVKHNENGCFIR